MAEGATPDPGAKKSLRSRWAPETPAAAPGPDPAPTRPPVMVTPPVLAPPIPRHRKAKKGPRVTRGSVPRSVAVPLVVEMRLRGFLSKTKLNFSAWVVRLLENDMDARGVPKVQLGEEVL